MLRIKNLSFGYTSQVILRNLNFSVSKGEHVSLIGASGSGKSTLLQAIYGLHHVEGEIYWEERQLLGPNFNLVPGEDFIKYLAQNFDLMPPLSVRENVGKFLSNADPDKKQKRIDQLLEIVEMSEFSEVKVRLLSGGQQQRVALARALADPPEMLLLDEPFSHIDHFRKNKLRRNLFAYLKENKISVMVATHDSTDALSFADRTFVLEEGKIIASGPPKHLYRHPDNVYIASLFGEVNEVPARSFFSSAPKDKKIILYPHEIHEVKGSTGTKSNVRRSYFKGSHFLIEATVGDHTVLFNSKKELVKGAEIRLSISEDVLRTRMA